MDPYYLGCTTKNQEINITRRISNEISVKLQLGCNGFETHAHAFTRKRRRMKQSTYFVDGWKTQCVYSSGLDFLQPSMGGYCWYNVMYEMGMKQLKNTQNNKTIFVCFLVFFSQVLYSNVRRSQLNYNQSPTATMHTYWWENDENWANFDENNVWRGSSDVNKFLTQKRQLHLDNTLSGRHNWSEVLNTIHYTWSKPFGRFCKIPKTSECILSNLTLVKLHSGNGPCRRSSKFFFRGFFFTSIEIGGAFAKGFKCDKSLFLSM